MMTDGVKHQEQEQQVQVMDVAQMIADASEL